MIVTVTPFMSLRDGVRGDRGKRKYDEYLRVHGSSDVTCAHSSAGAARVQRAATLSDIREREEDDRDDLERIRRRIPRRARRDLRWQEKAMTTRWMSPPKRLRSAPRTRRSDRRRHADVAHCRAHATPRDPSLRPPALKHVATSRRSPP